LVYPDILTLPGTVGRGFLSVFQKKIRWHMDIRMLREYPQTENGFFLKEKLKSEEAARRFLYGMEAAA
jgi:hypothetical protein